MTFTAHLRWPISCEKTKWSNPWLHFLHHYSKGFSGLSKRQITSLYMTLTLNQKLGTISSQPCLSHDIRLWLKPFPAAVFRWRMQFWLVISVMQLTLPVFKLGCSGNKERNSSSISSTKMWVRAYIYIGRSGLCKQPQPAGTLPLPGCLFLLLHFTFCHFSWTQYYKAHGFFFMWLKQFHITKKHGNDFLEIHGAVKSSLSLAFAFLFAHRRENSATTKE